MLLHSGEVIAKNSEPFASMEGPIGEVKMLTYILLYSNRQNRQIRQMLKLAMPLKNNLPAEGAAVDDGPDQPARHANETPISALYNVRGLCVNIKMQTVLRAAFRRAGISLRRRLLTLNTIRRAN